MIRTALLILGMHRSGTSALTWLAGQVGAALPADAIGAHDDNARGYWESAQLVKADDQLLRVCRSSWFDPRPLDWSRLPPGGLRSRMDRMKEAVAAQWDDAPLLAIKDPRQCRFVPVLAEALAEMGIASRAVLMLRNPAEIARSLAARDGTSPAYAHLLWLRHMIDAERATRGMQRIVLSYDALLADPRGAFMRLAQLAGREDWRINDATGAEVARFVDPALRRHRTRAAAPLEEPLAGIVASVRDGLARLIDADDAIARIQLDHGYAMLDAAPWLEGDIVHDELRHRRMPPGEAVAAPPIAEEKPDPVADAALIRLSGLFDADWYLARYPDAADSGLDPVDHYVREGAPRGYNPSPLFDTGFYARQMARRLAAQAREAAPV